ncbi:hypothetical protein M0R45_004256 [Rubus argutus]|uniref:Reverse transcriptase zinc-binding domain-containing protein n=1 Tax=Rubus argutus TaxID=59490 RepID=A0AAW1YJB9_RUBAR
MDMLTVCLPDNVIDHIVVVPIGTSNDAYDKIIWKLSSNGSFNVKSAYACSISASSLPDCFWKGIWALKIPPKLKLFSWTMVQGRLLTNVQRFRRKLTVDPSCKFCPGVPESMVHLLRDCPHAQLVWNAVNVPQSMQQTFNLDWNGWISANTLQANCKWHSFVWKDFFIFICWFIWKWRNKGVFDVQFIWPTNPLEVILNYASEWFSVSKVDNNPSEKRPALLHWQKPLPGVFKLNVDGSRTHQGIIGAGWCYQESHW